MSRSWWPSQSTLWWPSERAVICPWLEMEVWDAAIQTKCIPKTTYLIWSCTTDLSIFQDSRSREPPFVFRTSFPSLKPLKHQNLQFWPVLLESGRHLRSKVRSNFTFRSLWVIFRLWMALSPFRSWMKMSQMYYSSKWYPFRLNSKIFFRRSPPSAYSIMMLGIEFGTRDCGCWGQRMLLCTKWRWDVWWRPKTWLRW